MAAFIDITEGIFWKFHVRIIRLGSTDYQEIPEGAAFLPEISHFMGSVPNLYCQDSNDQVPAFLENCLFSLKQYIANMAIAAGFQGS
jgi:hypothetical protein